MWYLVLYRAHPPGPDAPRRAAHRARLAALREDGRLLLAGLLPAIDGPDDGEAGLAGSALVAEFPSLEEARRWAAEDPCLAAGCFAEPLVQPLTPVAP